MAQRRPHVADLSLRPRDGDTGFDTSNEPPAGDRPVAADVRWIECEREPVLRASAGIVKVCRHHADDDVRHSIDEDSLPDGICAARILSLPQRVAEDDQRVLPGNSGFGWK